MTTTFTPEDARLRTLVGWSAESPQNYRKKSQRVYRPPAGNRSAPQRCEINIVQRSNESRLSGAHMRKGEEEAQKALLEDPRLALRSMSRAVEITFLTRLFFATR